MKIEELFEYTESWRTMAGYPDYEVSNLGRGRNKLTKRILTPEEHYGRDKTEPYMRFQIRHNHANKHIRVNRIVALTFIGPPPEPGMEVDHKDKNRKNNKLRNLQWVTPEVNQQLKQQVQKKRRSIRDVVKKDSTNETT